MIFASTFLVGGLLALWWRFYGDAIGDRWETVFVWHNCPRCACCGSWLAKLRLEPSYTSYHWDGKWHDPHNPNRPFLLCPSCGEHHREYWADMWNEYISSRI